MDDIMELNLVCLRREMNQHQHHDHSCPKLLVLKRNKETKVEKGQPFKTDLAVSYLRKSLNVLLCKEGFLSLRLNKWVFNVLQRAVELTCYEQLTSVHINILQIIHHLERTCYKLCNFQLDQLIARITVSHHSSRPNAAVIPLV